VNRSAREFTVEDGGVRVGLDQVKGLSLAAVESILHRRRERPFASLADFMSRVAIVRKELESLVLCWAFDFTGRNRPQLVWEVKVFRGRARRTAAQRTLFAPPDPEDAPSLPDFSPAQKLRFELEVLEISVSRHPLEAFRPLLDARGLADSRAVPRRVGRPIRIAGVLDADRETETKHRTPMEFLTLEDEYGVFEVTLFPNVYKRFRREITDAGPYLIHGKVEEQYGVATVNATRVERISGEGLESRSEGERAQAAPGSALNRRAPASTMR
jgi:DNA polymerase III alpha subunit